MKQPTTITMVTRNTIPNTIEVMYASPNPEIAVKLICIDHKIFYIARARARARANVWNCTNIRTLHGIF